MKCKSDKENTFTLLKYLYTYPSCSYLINSAIIFTWTAIFWDTLFTIVKVVFLALTTTGPVAFIFLTVTHLSATELSSAIKTLVVCFCQGVTIMFASYMEISNVLDEALAAAHITN